MLLILLIGIELLIAYIYLATSQYYILLLVAFFYFIFWYTSDAAHTGNDAKPFFRSLRIWRVFTAVKYTHANVEEFNVESDRQLLFVLTSNITNMALISGFGLHGGVFNNLDVRYVLPSILLKIPILREILLWSGAVCANGNKDVEGTILRLLKKGKSVAYHPGGMSVLDVNDIPNDIFNFAREHKISIVPVHVGHECDRYVLVGRESPVICAMQRFFFKHIQYPVPFLFAPNVFGRTPPPKIELVVGIPMNPSVHQDGETFRKLFQGQINGFNNSV